MQMDLTNTKISDQKREKEIWSVEMLLVLSSIPGGIMTQFIPLYVLLLGGGIEGVGALIGVQGIFFIIIPSIIQTLRCASNNVILTLGTALFFASFIFMAMVPFWELVIPAIFLYLIGSHLMAYLERAIIKTTVNSRTNTHFYALSILGRSLGFALGGAIVDAFGFRSLLFFYALIALLSCLAKRIVLITRRLLAQTNTITNEIASSYTESFKAFLQMSNVRTIVLIDSFTTFIYFLTAGYDIIFMRTIVGISYLSLGLLLSAFGIFSLFWSTLTLPIARRIGFARVLAAIGFLLIVGTFLFVGSNYAGSNKITFLLGAFFCWSGPLGMYPIAIVPLLKRQKRVPDEQALYKTRELLNNIAMASAPMIGAFIWMFFNPISLFYTSIFFTLPAVLYYLVITSPRAT